MQSWACEEASQGSTGTEQLGIRATATATDPGNVNDVEVPRTSIPVPQAAPVADRDLKPGKDLPDKHVSQARTASHPVLSMRDFLPSTSGSRPESQQQFLDNSAPTGQNLQQFAPI